MEEPEASEDTEPSSPLYATKEELETYNRTKRPHKTENPHRNGPMPINERNDTPCSKYGTLDSDCDDLDWEKNRKNGTVQRKGLNAIVGQMLNLTVCQNPDEKAKNDAKLACSRNLIKYFARLGKVRIVVHKSL